MGQGGILEIGKRVWFRLARLTDVRIGGRSPAAPFFKWAERIMGGLSVFVGGFARANPQNFPDWAAKPITWLQAGWLLPAVLILAPMTVWGRKRTDRSKHRLVKELLDEICRQTFGDEDFDLEQHRRVTLFRFRNFCWRRPPFFGGFLVPIERSGEATRKSGSIFRAPDDGEAGTGIAGRTWSRRRMIYVDGLPDLRNGCDDEKFKEYAEKTFMGAAQLRNRPPQARALLGIPVDVNHRRWGVIVIDTVNTSIQRSSAEDLFKKLASPLSSILKEL